MKNQESWVINRLLENGSVSRNEAIRTYITRLGAIINRLNSENWLIKGGYQKTPHGKDYIYKVISSPYQKVEFKITETGQTITKWQKK